MSVILAINRDFPFQVALSFDDAAMEVLDWLEGCSFEWDMYVDLPANCVRYCFSHRHRRVGFQATIRACAGRASCRRPALIAARRIRSRHSALLRRRRLR